MSNKGDKNIEFDVYLRLLKSYKGLTNSDIAIEFNSKESRIKNMRFGSTKVDESLFAAIKDKYGDLQSENTGEVNEETIEYRRSDYMKKVEEEIDRLNSIIDNQNILIEMLKNKK